MSVSQVSTVTNQTISPAKKDDSNELSFEKAFANLSIIANLKIGEWIGVDLKEKNIIVWKYVYKWFYNPDSNISEFVDTTVKLVLNALENDKKNRPKIICDHKKISDGFKTAICTYSAYPDLSKKLEEVSVLWDQNKPSKEDISQANQLIILRTLRSVPRPVQTQVASFEGSSLYKKQREKSETAVVPQGDYPKGVQGRHNLSARQRAASALPFSEEPSGEIKPTRGGSSVLTGADFCEALLSHRSKILGTSEKAE